MQTRDQKYAADVYERVKKIEATPGDKAAKSYGSFAHKLPILIRTAGLAQALAFVEARGVEIKNSKEKKTGDLFLRDLAGTVGEQDAATLLRRVRTVELGEYIRLTQQVMDALLWYKRFAQSVLGVEQGDDEQAITDEGNNADNI